MSLKLERFAEKRLSQHQCVKMDQGARSRGHCGEAFPTTFVFLSRCRWCGDVFFLFLRVFLCCCALVFNVKIYEQILRKHYGSRDFSKSTFALFIFLRLGPLTTRRVCCERVQTMSNSQKHFLSALSKSCFEIDIVSPSSLTATARNLSCTSGLSWGCGFH